MALLACAAVQAQTVVGLHLESHHFPNSPEYNNANLGAYVHLQNGFSAGFYRNTYRKESYYIGETFHVGFVDVALGVVSGYQHTGNGNALLLPMFVPSVGLGTYWGLTPRLFVMPTGSTTVVHLGLETTL